MKFFVGNSNSIFIDATASRSGGGVYLNEIVPRIADLLPDYTIRLFCVNSDDLSGINKLNNRIDICSISMEKLGAGGELSKSFIKLIWRQLILPIYILCYRPRLVFSNSGFGPLLRILNTQFIFAIHDSVPYQDWETLGDITLFHRWRAIITRALFLLSLRNKDGIIVFSRDLSDKLSKHIRRSVSIRVIHHGIDAVPPLQGGVNGKLPHLIHKQNVRYLLYVSHFYSYKNIIRLLEAFRLLAVETDDLYLVLVGNAYDLNYSRFVKNMVDSDRDLSSKVKVVSGASREEVLQILNDSCAVVYPSLVENCPIALLESLSFGKPMAVSRIPSLVEILQDAVIYFDPADTVDICKNMRWLIEDPELRDELSQKAVVRAKAFSWDDSARETARYISELIEERNKVIEK